MALGDTGSGGPLLGKEVDFTPNVPDLIGDADIPVRPDLAAASGSGHNSAGARRGSVQVNDPTLDNIQTFTGTRPFEFSIQSETSTVSFGENVVVGYNSSANQPVVQLPSGGLAFTHRELSGYSFSHDGGRTWTSAFIPPSPGSPFTFGDPALAVDRAGNFYYASLAANAAGQSDITVSKSTDGGTTFAPAVIVALDPGSDKEWIAVGADPAHPERDNVYVTWTSFKANSSQLMFAQSTDGGATFSTRTLFAPADDGKMSAFIQFTQPTVDSSNGRLYIPFLHFSDFDADFVKVLVSGDGGATFHFLTFNVPGAPDAFGFPNVTPGTIADCGTNGGFRLILHSGLNIGGGRAGLPRYVHATRLVTQPSSAVHDGRLFIALNSSTSPSSGDPTSHSEIHMLFSPDGGQTFQVSVIAAATPSDPQHVHPALSIDSQGRHVSIGYYVQQANDQLRVDMANGQVTGNGVVWSEDAQNLSPAFDLIPSNIPIPTATNPFATTNYDRTIRPCYDIGEYMSTTFSQQRVLSAWGDNRNSWTSPAGSPAVGTHTQPDVFASVGTA
ncbi:MAG TPA: sialidase family protein [Candidatus Dormibacteraeota bacterium]|nr:sialidase family protein [Candidatus Dormibacteraeota bacterium]